jgi:hypothetical protein
MSTALTTHTASTDCAQTCRSTNTSEEQCGFADGEDVGFQCLDPTITERFPQCAADPVSYVGDGWCDYDGVYNTNACNWDGGDCCLTTCTRTARYECGENNFVCRNPNATDFNRCPLPDFELNLARQGDGVCDATGTRITQLLNTEACNWE